jgi:hypothetical protein
MAVTAHWIESVDEKTPTGIQKKLRLWADLIGFHKLPGQHTGEHLAHCFLFITDHIKITSKVSAIFIVFDIIKFRVTNRLDGLPVIMPPTTTP